ncbi:MAG: hypothetical protein CMH57_07685 [Myxococcales bacterium]|nr:hypothetical protein [Myxococcales bacterium]
MRSLARPLTLVVALISLVLLTHTERAEANGPAGEDLGAGIILGEPTGLTGKYWFDSSSAVDVHLSFDFSDDAFALISDYLLHFNVFTPDSRSIDLPVYVGIGGKFFVREDNNDRGDDDDLGLGLRAPVGLSLLLTQAPLEFFVEIALGLRIIPGTEADLDGGIGVRYYF